ncbi:hypothetical protein Nepgr_004266 [Nepenthes gracilis]|uniref:Uncharacterized protein n=1 Tax=Nepenthes gracilis TaxID=150966 RepID=A0AAD3XEY7_NEPGR|nr:hypothetical protein Nepgr_004266 [Nepenthes gracilis]
MQSSLTLTHSTSSALLFLCAIETIYEVKIFSLPLRFSVLLKMKLSNSVSPTLGPRKRGIHMRRFLLTLFLISTAVFIGSAFVVTNYRQRLSSWDIVCLLRKTRSQMCKDDSRPYGTEALPKGIVASTSDLEMRPLWGSPRKKKSPLNLLAMAVGIKQKESVNKIVKKFPSRNFIVMLFHYDGNVKDWRDLEWSDSMIHVSAVNQTKWWFAKRFLHPDIVSEYSYIFLWDEDLGVENFDVERYLSIINKEGLEISQPALDPDKSEVHHQLTARKKGAVVHRSINQLLRGGKRCDENSTGPPCTGWVEMMAPVFSRASWRCVWHMIQNDFVHAWGVDFQLGYCAQGDRTRKIGIVDSEYIVHYGLPTLGGSVGKKAASAFNKSEDRNAVRKQSLSDLERFKTRWTKAAKEDGQWTDQYRNPVK